MQFREASLIRVQSRVEKAWERIWMSGQNMSRTPGRPAHVEGTA